MGTDAAILEAIANAPVCDHPPVNSVEQVLYRPNLPDAILDGHYEWYGEGFCGGVVRIFNDRGSCLICGKSP